MKHTKTVEVPATTRTEVDKVTCDFCGKEIWVRAYEINRVEISHERGESYPEGGSKTVVSVDMCADCFKSKLLPWARSLGVEPQTEERDW